MLNIRFLFNREKNAKKKGHKKTERSEDCSPLRSVSFEFY